MAMKVDLLDSDCGWMPPTTWWVRATDGTYLLVTKLELHRLSTGLPIATVRTNIPTGVVVFYSDSRGQPVDADGDPANGMTPVIELPDGDHTAGLSALGYALFGG